MFSSRCMEFQKCEPIAMLGFRRRTEEERFSKQIGEGVFVMLRVLGGGVRHKHSVSHNSGDEWIFHSGGEVNGLIDGPVNQCATGVSFVGGSNFSISSMRRFIFFT